MRRLSASHSSHNLACREAHEETGLPAEKYQTHRGGCESTKLIEDDLHRHHTTILEVGSQITDPNTIPEHTAKLVAPLKPIMDSLIAQHDPEPMDGGIKILPKHEKFEAISVPEASEPMSIPLVSVPDIPAYGIGVDNMSNRLTQMAGRQAARCPLGTERNEECVIDDHGMCSTHGTMKYQDTHLWVDRNSYLNNKVHFVYVYDKNGCAIR